MPQILDTSGNNVSIEELRKIVTKESDDRLLAELKCGQKHFNETTLGLMKRDELIKHVTCLRELNGQTIAVKAHINAFDVLQTTTMQTSSMTNTASAVGNPTQINTPTSSDMSGMFALLMQQMQQQQQQMQQQQQLAQQQMLKQEQQRAAEQQLMQQQMLKQEQQRAAELQLMQQQRADELANKKQQQLTCNSKC